jgi:hypothetical protein
MILRSTPIILCLAVTAADCAWDAPRHSDFITFGAGESTARARVLQPREIWPKDSLDNDIEFDASRFVPSIPSDDSKYARPSTSSETQSSAPITPIGGNSN